MTREIPGPASIRLDALYPPEHRTHFVSYDHLLGKVWSAVATDPVGMAMRDEGVALTRVESSSVFAYNRLLPASAGVNAYGLPYSWESMSLTVFHPDKTAQLDALYPPISRFARRDGIITYEGRDKEEAPIYFDYLLWRNNKNIPAVSFAIRSSHTAEPVSRQLHVLRRGDRGLIKGQVDRFGSYFTIPSNPNPSDAPYRTVRGF